MLAAFVTSFDAGQPARALEVGSRPEPEPPPGWAVVDVRAASINHHDVFALRGVGLRSDRLPMILGCDASGVAEDGREVILHALIRSDGWAGPELEDPRLSMLSERAQGTFAERVTVPRANLLDKPPDLTFGEASCLPTAWLTAYRMVVHQAAVPPGGTVLVQGAGGGMSAALVALAAAMGLRVWVTGRTEKKRAFALSQGADQAFEPGARLPAKVDAVFDSVGAATWTHSLQVLRPHGTLVVAGGTSGYEVTMNVGRVFSRQLRIQGSGMGTREDLADLIALCAGQGIRPAVQAELPLAQARAGVAAVAASDVRGKIVLVP
jgi:NADPH:quinone reductase-like Zn-dependent oxidoreductase